MSASADYGVKLVESFAPPKNWTPGQEVNKDVYAVNTGSIAAFVEEKVSSVMTVTRETRVDAWDADCTELTEAEKYSMEAGSYLAYVSDDTSAHKAGDKIVDFTPSPTDLNGYTENPVTDFPVTDFTPDKTGTYVFRRSIKVPNNDGKGETFEYAGYYYDATSKKYYKIDLISITPDKIADNAGDKEKTDGNLTDVTVQYFKDVTTKETPTLVYDAAGHKLVATVKGSSYITDAKLKEYAEEYEKAKHDYQTALAEQTRALAEDGTASQNLRDKLAALNAAKKAEADAKEDFEEALKAYKALESEKNAVETELGSDSTSGVAKTDLDNLKALFGDSWTGHTPPTDYDTWVGADIETSETYGGLYADMKTKYAAKNGAADSEAAFLADLQAWIGAQNLTSDGALGVAGYTYNANDNLSTLVAGISYAKLQDFKTWIAGQPNSENHQKAVKEADYYIAKKKYDDKVKETKISNALYNNLNTRLNDASSGLTQALSEAATALKGSESLDLTQSYDNIMNAANSAVDGLTKTDTEDGTSTYEQWKKAAIETEKAQDAYTTAQNDATTGTTVTSEHLTAANQAVAEAKAKMDLAEKLYNRAVTEYNAAHDIIVNIYLANDVTEGGAVGKWQILPSTVAGNEAVFYYTSILEGGETSNMLIDKVELDKSVTQDMYKYFDFDLNVAMKSAQILYANDNETILATAANGDGTNLGQLDANATLVAPTNIDTAITWTAR